MLAGLSIIPTILYVFDVVFIISSFASFENLLSWVNSYPSLTLVPTSKVIVSPTFNSTLPFVFKCVGIRISFSFSGNLPSTNFTDNSSIASLEKPFT